MRQCIWRLMEEIFRKECLPDYLEYIRQMQRSFEELDVVLDHLDEMAEEGKIDRYLVKSVFYALYFGEDRIWLSTERYMQFADCFVNYEERTKTVYHEDETTTQEILYGGNSDHGKDRDLSEAGAELWKNGDL